MALTMCMHIGRCNKGGRGRSVDDGINGVVCMYHGNDYGNKYIFTSDIQGKGRKYMSE